MLRLNRLLAGILNFFTNPVILVSTVGLMLFQGIYQSLEKSPVIAAVVDGKSTGPTVHALLDFQLQMFVLILAWILFWIDVGNKIVNQTKTHPHITVEKFVDQLKNSVSMKVFGAVCLANGVGMLIFFNNFAHSQDLVLAYTPSPFPKAGGVHIPPLNSSITWLRVSVALSAYIIAMLDINRDLSSLVRVRTAIVVLLSCIGILLIGYFAFQTFAG